MNNKSLLIILWMLFGFVLFISIEALIHGAIYAYFHLTLELEVLPYYFKMSTFILCAFIFDFVCMSVFKSLHNHSLKLDVFENKPPTIVFVITLLMAIVLNPLVRWFDDRHLKQLVDAPIREDYMSELNIANLYETMNLSISLCFWSIVVFLILFCLYSLKTN